MKMSDNLCDPKSEPGFLTNCRLCLNESDFPVVSIFDEKYKNDDLPRKIMLLTNIVITAPPNSVHNILSVRNNPNVPPTTICLKCKNKVDSFLSWKDEAWIVQQHFKVKTEAADPSRPSHHQPTNHFRHIRQQPPSSGGLAPIKSEKLPLGHRSSNDSCIDEDYDSLPSSPRSPLPSSPHSPGPRHYEHGRENPRHYEDARRENFEYNRGEPRLYEMSREDPRHYDHEREDPRHCDRDEEDAEEDMRHPPHHLMMEPVVKIEEESVEYPGDYGGGGDGDPDSTELVIDETDENRLRHEQNRIQHFLSRGGTNSILRSLISSELPISRPGGQAEASVLTNRTNLPISPALPPFKLDESNKDRPSSTTYRRKQKHPTRNGHETEDSSRPGNVHCALRSLPDDVLSQKLPVPCSSSSSSSSGSSHPTSTVIIAPTSSSSHTSQPSASSPSPKKARKSMYPFNYLLEAIDFTSRQNSPENTCDAAPSTNSSSDPVETLATSSGLEEKEPMEQEPESLPVAREEVEEDVVEEREEDVVPAARSQHHTSVIEEIRRDLQERQRQEQIQHQQQREQDSRIIQQHLREQLAAVMGARTQDPGIEHNNHDYSARPNPHQQVLNIKLNASLLSPSTNMIPSALTNGYCPEFKAASHSSEISLKNLLSSNQAAAPAPTILKKVRVRNNGHLGNSSPSNRDHGPSVHPNSPSPSPSPSPLCLSPQPLPLPLTATSEADSPRSSPKIRFSSGVNGAQSPYTNIPLGQILPKRHDLACTNCNTKVTTIWRRYPSGEMVCNACGLYYRLHCRPRPVSMRRDNIHPRKRRPKASGPGERSKQHSLHTSHDSGDNKSVSSGDESSSISLNSLISASFHGHPPFLAAGRGSPHHSVHPFSLNALNLSPLMQCEDNLPLNLAAPSVQPPPAVELAR